MALRKKKQRDSHFFQKSVSLPANLAGEVEVNVLTRGNRNPIHGGWSEPPIAQGCQNLVVDPVAQ
jgi:hypothetical protein